MSDDTALAPGVHPGLGVCVILVPASGMLCVCVDGGFVLESSSAVEGVRGVGRGRVGCVWVRGRGRVGMGGG